MRSWRSTAAHSPGDAAAASSTSSVPTMSPRSSASRKNAGRGERLVVGERLLGQPAPDGVVGDVDPRQRVAERAGVGRCTRRRSGVASASASSSSELRPGLVGLGAVLLGEDAEEAVPVHLEQHDEARGAAGEGRGDHAPVPGSR